MTNLRIEPLRAHPYLTALDTCIRNRMLPLQGSPLGSDFEASVTGWASGRYDIQRTRRCDTHIGSINSDGEMSIEEILQRATDSNVGTIAVSDHNMIGNIQVDMPLAFNRGIDYMPCVELTMLFNGAEGHFKSYFNPFDTSIINIVAQVRTRYEIETRGQIEQMMNMAPGEVDELLMGQRSKRFFELPAIADHDIDAGEVVAILTEGIERLKATTLDQRKLLVERALHFENLAEAMTDPGLRIIGTRDSSEGKRQYLVFRNFILHILAPEVRIESLAQHDALSSLMDLRNFGAWTVFSHPGKRELAFGSRETVESEIRFFARHDYIQGMETAFGGYDEEINARYSAFYAGLLNELGSGVAEHFLPDGGSDAHTQQDTIGADLPGYFDVLSRIRWHLAEPVLRKAQEIGVAQDLGPEERFWALINQYRMASIVDPYNLDTYRNIARLLANPF